MAARLSGAATGVEPASGVAMAELRVAEIMAPEPLVLGVETPLRIAVLLFCHTDIGGAPVVAADGSLVGVLSERDLLEEAKARDGPGRAARVAQRRRTARTVGQACARPAHTTNPDAPVRSAARVMADLGVDRLVVVDGGRVTGIVTRHDVLRALNRTDVQLQVEVEALAAEFDRFDLGVQITWGEVALAGAMRLRSGRDELVACVAKMDGVLSVDADELGWQVDDTQPAMWPP